MTRRISVFIPGLRAVPGRLLESAKGRANDREFLGRGPCLVVFMGYRTARDDRGLSDLTLDFEVADDPGDWQGAGFPGADLNQLVTGYS